MPDPGNGHLSRLGPWLSFGLFLVYALVFGLLKGGYAHVVEFPSHLFVCSEIHTCMRVGDNLLGAALSTIIEVAVGLLFMDPSTSTLLPQSPWGMGTPPPSEQAKAISTAVFILKRVIFLLPVLWLATVFFRGVFIRLLFLTVIFMALAGWPPPVLDVYFTIMGNIADWPKSYYMFALRIGPHDFGSIGFNLLLVLYIARRSRKRLWEVAGLTVLGQLIFENNGIVTGIAFFTATLLIPAEAPTVNRFRLALQRLGISALASVSLVMFFVAIFFARGNGIDDGAAGVLTIIPNYFQEYWRNVGVINFGWFNVTVANFITLVSIPAVFGAVVGSVSALSNRGSGKRWYRQAETDGLAALCAAAGFFTTVIIGLFVSGMGSDMGRQMLPMVCLVLVFSAKYTEAVIGARMRG